MLPLPPLPVFSRSDMKWKDFRRPYCSGETDIILSDLVIFWISKENDLHTQTFYKLLSQCLLSLQDSLSSILTIPNFPRFRDLPFKFYSGLHTVPEKSTSHCKTHSPLCSPLSYKQKVSGSGWMLMNFLVCTVAAHSSHRKCPMSADRCAYASSKLVFPFATGTDFLIV